MFFRLNIVRATPAGGHKLAGLRKVFGKEEPSTGRVPPVLSLPVQGGQGGRRTRDPPPTHGRNSSCTGLQDAWLAQGQHPATECVVIALFVDEDSLRRLEGSLRSDPLRGGDFFALLSLTTQPPDVTQYEIRS